MQHRPPHRSTIESYERAAFRASYYAWSARKGHALAGGDPVTGQPRHWARDRGEGRAAFKALARHWFAIARGMRVAMPSRLP